jgi:isocitrate/isopropylmalate dehydrogenase
MMLEHGFGRAADAHRIEAAVDAVLDRGLRTPDLLHGTVGPPPLAEHPTQETEAGTEEMTEAVLEAL